MLVSFGYLVCNILVSDFSIAKKKQLFFDTIQGGVSGVLASIMGGGYQKYNSKHVNPAYTGKENYINYSDFISLYSSAMIQALPTAEISVFSNECTPPTNT